MRPVFSYFYLCKYILTHEDNFFTHKFEQLAKDHNATSFVRCKPFLFLSGLKTTPLLPLYFCSESTAFVTRPLNSFSDTTRKGLCWSRWHACYVWHLSFSFWVSVIILHVSLVTGARPLAAAGWQNRSIWSLQEKQCHTSLVLAIIFDFCLCY